MSNPINLITHQFIVSIPTVLNQKKTRSEVYKVAIKAQSSCNNIITLQFGLQQLFFPQKAAKYTNTYTLGEIKINISATINSFQLRVSTADGG